MKIQFNKCDLNENIYKKFTYHSNNTITKSKYSIYITTDSISYLNDIKNLLGESEVAFGNYNTEVLSKNSKLYGISRYQMKAIEKGGKIYQITF